MPQSCRTYAMGTAKCHGAAARVPQAMDYATELPRNAMGRRAAPVSQGRTVPGAKSVTV